MNFFEDFASRRRYNVIKNKNTKSKKADIRKDEDNFIIIEASKISKKVDLFLQYTTRTIEEKN